MISGILWGGFVFLENIMDLLGPKLISFLLLFVIDGGFYLTGLIDEDSGKLNASSNVEFANDCIN